MKNKYFLWLLLLVLSMNGYAQLASEVRGVIGAKSAVKSLTKNATRGAPFRAVPQSPPTGISMPAYLKALNADVAAGIPTITWRTAAQILQSPTKNLTTEQVVQTLKRLDSSTLKEAVEQAAMVPDDLHLPYDPTVQFVTSWGSPFHTQEIYPQHTFLTVGNEETRELTIGHYISAAHNRRYIQTARQFQFLYPRLKETVPLMEKMAASQVQPADKEWWLAKLIPSSTEWLFIGEVHFEENIRQSVRRFLTLLRQERPDQEIILMTEFLPDSPVWYDEYHLKDYDPTWETAAANNIKVMGLEKIEMRRAIEGWLLGMKIDSHGERYRFPASLEGLSIRNRTWVETLKKCREEHPNALIVVYAGAMHVSYNFPYSLSNLMNKEKMFVVGFYPDKGSPEEAEIEPWYPWYSQDWRVDPLEIMYQHAAFPQPALYWEDPALAKLAGYNARLKISRGSN